MKLIGNIDLNVPEFSDFYKKNFYFENENTVNK